MYPDYTLEDWVARWERFIGEIRAGYDRYPEEYDNDVDIRSGVQNKLDGARGDTDEDLLKKIYELDQEFLALTRECKRPPRRPEPWWSNRVPLYPGPELAADMAFYDK